MENASKALIMAAGVLIGILILSLAAYLYMDFGTSASQVNSQVKEQQMAQFNNKFTSYEGQEGLTIYDVITVASYAHENNLYYENDNDYQIEVWIGTRRIDNIINDEKIGMIQDDRDNMIDDKKLYTYSCEITGYRQNGRVHKIKFIRNQ